MHLGGTNSPLPNSPTDSRKLSPLSRSHINPAWSVFPAPEQVHLAPYITSRQGHLVPFPMFSLGKSNLLTSSSGQTARPCPWARLRHPAQPHTGRRTAPRCFVHSVNLRNPYKTAVRCLWLLACGETGRQPFAVALQWGLV